MPGQHLLRLLADVTSDLIGVQPGELPEAVDRTLARMGRLFAVDRVYVFEYSADRTTLSNTFEWTAPGISPEKDNLQGIPDDAVPWWMARLHAGHEIRLASLAQLPPEAAAERAILEPQGIQALLVMPLAWRGRLDGFVGFDHVRSHRIWSEEEVAVLRIVVSALAQSIERRALGQQLEQMAYYDALTGLPNRALLADRMRDALLAVVEGRPGLLAVCYIDLDSFKSVNDSRGHQSGDHVLVAIARRLVSLLRPGDTVARLGGDEFVLLLPDLRDRDECDALLERVLNLVSQPVDLSATDSVSLTASIGVRLVPPDLGEPDTLLRQADKAMYAAKQEGRGRIHLFDPALERQQAQRNDRVAGVRRALARREMCLHFQPIIELATGQVRLAEALVRWAQPDGSLVPPDDWIPAIEETPAMAELGVFVLEEALAQCEAWRALGYLTGVSVNVSGYELRDPGFTRRVEQALARHPGVPPSALRLEVVESAALNDLAAVTHSMRECGALGVDFALDDFGTGYSSLSYLKRLPVGTIKIDRSFVADMLSDPYSHAIVTGVIELARVFGRRSVAEGVETAEQAEALRGLRCDLAQGYGIARPMPAEALQAWLGQRLPQ